MTIEKLVGMRARVLKPLAVPARQAVRFSGKAAAAPVGNEWGRILT